MYFVNSIDGIRQRIQNEYYNGETYSNGYDRARMLGLVFGRPESELVQREITPSLSYFNERSAFAIDFFFGGYISPNESEHNHYDDQEPLGKAGRAGQGSFSATAFNRFREELESVSSWRYSGAVDLMLLTSRMSDRSELSLDFRRTLVLNLQQCREAGLIPSVGEFFEQIFRFAHEYRGDDPVSAFSDAQGKRVAASAAAGGLKSFIPEILHKEIDRTVAFSVKNCEP